MSATPPSPRGGATLARPDTRRDRSPAGSAARARSPRAGPPAPRPRRRLPSPSAAAPTAATPPPPPRPQPRQRRAVGMHPLAVVEDRARLVEIARPARGLGTKAP